MATGGVASIRRLALDDGHDRLDAFGSLSLATDDIASINQKPRVPESSVLVRHRSVASSVTATPPSDSSRPHAVAGLPCSARAAATLATVPLRSPAAVSGPAGSVVGVSGVVAGDERVEDFADRGALGVVEERGGFEGETECLVVGEAGVVAEDEGVSGAREGDGQSPQCGEGWFGSAGFVLAQLGDVDAGALGQRHLGEVAGPAQAGKRLGEGHGRKRYRRLGLDGCCYAR
jgi:hypothetical protein